MTATAQSTTVKPIVQAIVNHFDGDYEHVLAFFNIAGPRLKGAHPLTNAILDELVEWMSDERFRKYTKPALHGVEEVTDWHMGEVSRWDYDAPIIPGDDEY